jgi:pSer/pThr/pTyr-binding forkhead associated (FHA) protein
VAYLRIVSGTQKGRRFEIERELTGIGRSSQNIVVINDASVSARHCEIERTGRRLFLRDLGSTNGTRLNDVLITEHQLSPGDKVTVGTVETVVEGNDIDAYMPERSQDDDTERTVWIPPSQAAAPVPPVFDRRKDRASFWLVAVVLMAAVAAMALSFFLYRLFAN